MRATILCAALAVWAACKPVDKTPPGSEPPAAPTTLGGPVAIVATKVLSVEGFLTPESVFHDSAQDIYFVSNINGSPTAKDNNGFISRLRPDGAVENLKFIEGGKNGVTLNAPKAWRCSATRCGWRTSMPYAPSTRSRAPRSTA